MLTHLVQAIIAGGALTLIGIAARDAHMRGKARVRAAYPPAVTTESTHLRGLVRTHRVVDPAPAIRAYRERRDFHRGVSR